MKKKFSTLIFLALWTAHLFAQRTNFKHDWDVKYLEHDIQFISKKKAPLPFSQIEEPQAIMYVGASQLDSSSKKDLAQIVNMEIEGIRNDLLIQEYLETDYKAKDNIVSYFKKVNGVKIGVIKYRSNGSKKDMPTMTRSVRQILFIHNGKLWISSLIVLFAEYQDDMRSDQMTFINAILSKQ